MEHKWPMSQRKDTSQHCSLDKYNSELIYTTKMAISERKRDLLMISKHKPTGGKKEKHEGFMWCLEVTILVHDCWQNIMVPLL
jgi:hypothetical protein